MTLEEVGEKFKVTRERVRQIQTMAMHKMRRILSENERQRSKDDLLAERIEQKKMQVLKDFFAQHSA
jgi:RNA polymerase primary sigma factor